MKLQHLGSVDIVEIEVPRDRVERMAAGRMPEHDDGLQSGNVVALPETSVFKMVRLSSMNNASDQNEDGMFILKGGVSWYNMLDKCWIHEATIKDYATERDELLDVAWTPESEDTIVCKRGYTTHVAQPQLLIHFF